MHSRGRSPTCVAPSRRRSHIGATADLAAACSERRTAMVQFLEKAMPLLMALGFSLIGVVASLIAGLGAEPEVQRRKDLAIELFRDSLPRSLCLATFSFDIWAMTLIYSSDPTTLSKYDLAGKQAVVQLLLVVHFILYITVLGWGGLVRAHWVNLILAVLATALCVGFEWWL